MHAQEPRLFRDPHQAGAAEGVYATGFVTFSGIPAFLHGPRHTATLNLRRIEEVVSHAVVEDFTARERAKASPSLPPCACRPGFSMTAHLRSRGESVDAVWTVTPRLPLSLLSLAIQMPCSLRLEPLRFSSGRRVDVAVGEILPETTVTVCNTAGQRLTRTFLHVSHNNAAWVWC